MYFHHYTVQWSGSFLPLIGTYRSTHATTRERHNLHHPELLQTIPSSSSGSERWSRTVGLMYAILGWHTNLYINTGPAAVRACTRSSYLFAYVNKVNPACCCVKPPQRESILLHLTQTEGVHADLETSQHFHIMPAYQNQCWLTPLLSLSLYQ